MANSRSSANLAASQKCRRCSNKWFVASCIAAGIIAFVALWLLHEAVEKPSFAAGSIDDPNAQFPEEAMPRMLNGSANSGVIIVHGFAATAWETRMMADFLNARNITTYQVLMGGHGEGIYALEASTHEDWYNSVEDAYSKIGTKKVFVVGVSAGGLTAMELALNKKVDGVVLISAPVWFGSWKMRSSAALKYFFRYSPRVLEAQHQKFYHGTFPARSAANLKGYADIMHGRIAELSAPLLIFQSEADPTVKPESAQYIYNNAASQDKEVVWLKGGKHVPIVKYENESSIVALEREVIFEDIYDFIIERS